MKTCLCSAECFPYLTLSSLNTGAGQCQEISLIKSWLTDWHSSQCLYSIFQYDEALSGKGGGTKENYYWQGHLLSQREISSPCPGHSLLLKDKKYLQTNIWVVSEIEENYEMFVFILLRIVKKIVCYFSTHLHETWFQYKELMTWESLEVWHQKRIQLSRLGKIIHTLQLKKDPVSPPPCCSTSSLVICDSLWSRLNNWITTTRHSLKLLIQFVPLRAKLLAEEKCF